MRRRVDLSGPWGAALLGILFAFAFCPVSAALFFGSLVPLAADRGSPLLLPSVYGVGTALPVVGFAVLLAMGVRWLGSAFDRVQQLERWARRLTAVVFIGLGVYETLRSTLYVISV